MNKTFIKLLILFGILFSVNLNSQSWTNINAAEQDDYVYTLTTYNGELYTAGIFDSTRYWGAGSTVFSRRIARWNGTNWNTLDKGVYSPNAYMGIYATEIYNNELYVAGDVDSAGSIDVTNNIAKWNGTSWNIVGSGSTYIGSLSALCVFNGELYVGGGRGLNKWDGTTWTNILPNSLNHAVTAMGVYNNELYVAGMSSVSGTPYKNIARYNGSTWSAVGAGLPAAFVKCMAVFNNELYVGGDIDTAGTTKVRNLAKWNGSAWSDVGGGANARVSALLPYGQNLYLSGAFWKVGSADISSNRAAAWNGTAFTAMGGLTGGEDLAIFNGQLYGLGAKNVQRWTGTVSGLNNKNTNDVFSLNVYPSPSSGVLTVESEEEIDELSIFDMTCKKIFCSKKVNKSERIDLGFVESGVYFIKVMTDKGAVSQKLIIQK